MLLYQGFIRPSYDYPGIQVDTLIRKYRAFDYENKK